MKALAFLVPVALVAAPALGADPVMTKAECDAVLSAEVKRLEEGFARTRSAWEQSVEQRFSEHKELTDAQMQTARATFNQAVVELSSAHMKTVALPGMYRMMLAIPQYDLAVCSDTAQIRTLGDQAIAGFLMQLTALLPLVETSVKAAKQ
jgi:hypothetical protein